MFPVSIFTLGCKLNQLEGEAIAGAFINEGFQLTPWGGPGSLPGILIVNTCTVTSKADQKARRVIRKALRDNPESCVIVTGCYARLDHAVIEELEHEFSGNCCSGAGISGRRLFVPQKGGGGIAAGAGEEKSLLLALPAFIRRTAEINPHAALPAILELWMNGPQENASAFDFKPAAFVFHSRSYLKIQDGCDNHCTYCRVRIARGAAASLPPEEALTQLLALESSGCAEAMLTGINITQYRSKGMDLAALLDYLLGSSSSIALRLASLEPEGITRGLARVIAHPRIRPHFHISVQSGSDSILKKMGRVYESRAVEECAALLREAKENPFLGCDIIAGFPGETESEFSKTVALCEKINCAWIHAFPYSRRPGTAAFSYNNSVCERDVAQRVAVLTEMALRNRREYARCWLGKKLNAIAEKGAAGTENQCRAVSENYLKLLVNFRGGAPQHGTAIQVVPSALCEGADGEKPDAVADLAAQ